MQAQVLNIKVECSTILKRRSVADISAFCWKFSSADLLLCASSRCKPLKILTKCFLQIMIIIMCFLIDLPIFSEFHRIYSSTCPVAAAAIFRWAANKEKQFDVIDQCDWWKAQISRNLKEPVLLPINVFSILHTAKFGKDSLKPANQGYIQRKFHAIMGEKQKSPFFYD